MKKEMLLLLILEFTIIMFVQNYSIKIIFSLFILVLFIIYFHFITLSKLKTSLKEEKILLKDAYFILTDNFIVSLDVLNKFKLRYNDIDSYETKWSWRLAYFNRIICLYTFDKKVYKVLLYRTKYPGLSLEEFSEKAVLKILKNKCNMNLKKND